jgi:DNA-binding transcriptional LysR family regulator
MDVLQSMKVFVRVAQRAGFASAGRDLRMSAGAVSKHIAALEQRLGTRLLDRTTRRVGLTEAGHLYLERCQECLQAVDDADASVNALSAEARGVLRVTAPVDFGPPMATLLADFMLRNPGILVDLRLSNRSLDLVEEGIDVAVRVASSLEGPYVARLLARTRLAMWGSPDYLRKHGRPRAPQDLARHRHLVFAEPRILDEWTFERDGQKERVKLTPAMLSNNGSALWMAALHGVGLSVVPSFMSGSDYAAGLVEPVLPDWSLTELRVYALYPQRRFVPPKVRVFVDALRAIYGDGTRDPWWPPVTVGGRAHRSR